jgi:hypothetical protein
LVHEIQARLAGGKIVEDMNFAISDRHELVDEFTSNVSDSSGHENSTIMHRKGLPSVPIQLDTKAPTHLQDGPDKSNPDGCGGSLGRDKAKPAGRSFLARIFRVPAPVTRLQTRDSPPSSRPLTLQ